MLQRRTSPRGTTLRLTFQHSAICPALNWPACLIRGYPTAKVPLQSLHQKAIARRTQDKAALVSNTFVASSRICRINRTALRTTAQMSQASKTMCRTTSPTLPRAIRQTVSIALPASSAQASSMVPSLVPRITTMASRHPTHLQCNHKTPCKVMALIPLVGCLASSVSTVLLFLLTTTRRRNLQCHSFT